VHRRRDEAVPAEVLKWRVTPIPIERNVRHMDRTAQLDVYTAIEKFWRAKSTTLQY
jgi:hypothetical protein